MSGPVAVRAAEPRDLDWLAAHDGHRDAAALAPKIAAGEVLVAEREGERVGLLRFDLLWSVVPFVALIRVLEPERRTGVGRALLAALEREGLERGAPLILSSCTGGEEEPLAWHRHVGFEHWGTLPDVEPEGTDEVFLHKRLRTAPRSP